MTTTEVMTLQEAGEEPIERRRYRVKCDCGCVRVTIMAADLPYLCPACGSTEWPEVQEVYS